jgi:hypothetical protein
LAQEAGALQSHRLSSALGVREINVAGSRSTVPLFGLTRQDERLGARLTERVAKVLEHGQFILGPEVAELESALARYAGVRHAVGVSSGRDALIIALMALGVGARDAVFGPGVHILRHSGRSGRGGRSAGLHRYRSGNLQHGC